MQTIYAYRHSIAQHIGDTEAAERYYGQWCTAPRDDLSDCVGCDPSSKAYWLAEQRRDEDAIAMAEPVLAGTFTCSEQPQSILTAYSSRTPAPAGSTRPGTRTGGRTGCSDQVLPSWRALALIYASVR